VLRIYTVWLALALDGGTPLLVLPSSLTPALVECALVLLWNLSIVLQSNWKRWISKLYICSQDEVGQTQSVASQNQKLH
jgi:hypothetical protein